METINLAVSSSLLAHIFSPWISHIIFSILCITFSPWLYVSPSLLSVRSYFLSFHSPTRLLYLS